MDKGCLILVPRSDLLRPRGQVFDRFEISHFLPLPRYKMQLKGFNFFMLSPANMGHFFSWVCSFFFDQNTNISSWGYDGCLIQWFRVLQLFYLIFLGKIGFSWWPPVATARCELEICMPANVMEWHAVGPQPAYKTFKDILIVPLGSIVVKEWVFLYTSVFCHFLIKLISFYSK